jgi:hypothetical protein
MGSEESGEELVAGHKNQTNDTTSIIACRRSAEEDDEDAQFWNSNDKSILLVTPSSIVGDRPERKLDGIIGIAQRGGAGVRGVGNQPDGRSGRIGSGNGGDGVVGQGGTGDLEWGIGIHQHPGMGVLGIGGIWTGPAKVDGRHPSALRDQRGGAGVVGVAAGDQAPGPWVPPFDDTKGVGVYGISAVGAGVYGISSAAEGMVAQGAENAPGLRATGNFGVEASGRAIGIKAVGGVVGVQGISNYGPAGHFWRVSEMALPQVYILPTPMPVPAPVQMESFSVLPPNEVDQLPQNAYAGELLMTIQASKGVKNEPGAEATLWLCVVGSYSGPQDKSYVPAIWKQVLLGPPIAGKKNNASWGLG